MCIRGLPDTYTLSLGPHSHQSLKVKVHSLYKPIKEYQLWVLVETFYSVQNQHHHNIPQSQ